MGRLITICSLLWEKNEHSHEFSQAYDASWAQKLFNGFRRHLTVPARYVLYTDIRRNLPSNIEQVIQPDLGVNGYGDCVRPYEMNVPMILVGLDTIVVGNCDKFAKWCMDNPGKLALPKHPYEAWSINGVQFWGGHNPDIFGKWRGENDMDWMRAQPHERIEALWGEEKVLSYRAHVHHRRLPQKAKLVYFHGRMKPPELLHYSVVRDNWR